MKPCSSYSMRLANERKEYRLICRATLDHVLTTPSLSDGAKVMWMAIYSLAGLDDELTTTASATFLSRRLDKSVSTIWRYMKELRVAGYLSVATKTGELNQNLPNKVSPRLPVSIMTLITKTATDREVVSSCITGRDLSGLSDFTETTRDYKNGANDPYFDHEPIKQTQNFMSDWALWARESALEGDNDSKMTNDMGRSKKSPISHSIDKPLLSNSEGVESETGEGGKSDTQDTNSSHREVITKTNGLSTFHSRDGQGLYPHVRFKLQRRLQHLGIELDRAKRLVSEIDYATWAGSMRDWPLTKAINVSVKLIQEGRWSTPRQMTQHYRGEVISVDA